MVTQDKLLTEKDAAEHLQLSVKTLQRWRYQSTGPCYARLNGSVRYRICALDSWVEENTWDTTDTER